MRVDPTKPFQEVEAVLIEAHFEDQSYLFKPNERDHKRRWQLKLPIAGRAYVLALLNLNEQQDLITEFKFVDAEHEGRNRRTLCRTLDEVKHVARGIQP